MLQKAGINLVKELCKHAPVRPNIPYKRRVQPCWNEVIYLEFENKIDAVLCVAHLNDIPINENELMSMEHGFVSVFYTVWSNRKGQGRQVLFDTMDLLKKQNPISQRYVTLSPKTEMAMKFHLGNGAVLLRENEETNNFEYE